MVLTMTTHYVAIDLELATRTREWNKQKAKLENKIRSVQDSESLFHDQLEKDAKVLMKKDDHISELIKEGKDQFTFNWS